MAANNRKVILIRTYTAFAFMCVFAVAIVAYLFKIQFKEREKWIALSENLSTTIQTIEPSRGNIFAVDGSLLATSLPIYDLRSDGKAPPSIPCTLPAELVILEGSTLGAFE